MLIRHREKIMEGLLMNELVKKNLDHILENHEVRMTRGGGLYINDVMATPNTITIFIKYPFIEKKERDFKDRQRELINELKRAVMKRPEKVLRDTWNFFDKFKIVDGQPQYAGLPFKPFLKYIESIFRMEKQPLDAMKIELVKQEITKRLREQI